MIWINGKPCRNLEEQVAENMKNIASLSFPKLMASGRVDDVPDLPKLGEDKIGTVYAVGKESPYYFYLMEGLTAQGGSIWTNLGTFESKVEGPKGPQGEQGLKGENGATWIIGLDDPNGILGKENDLFLNLFTGDVFKFNNNKWKKYGSIRGPQGPQGIRGLQGEQGEVGPQGEQGIKGDPGTTFSIVGVAENESTLPAPSTVNRNSAYLIKNQTNPSLYDMYVVVGTAELRWMNTGALHLDQEAINELYAMIAEIENNKTNFGTYTVPPIQATDKKQFFIEIINLFKNQKVSSMVRSGEPEVIQPIFDLFGKPEDFDDRTLHAYVIFELLSNTQQFAFRMILCESSFNKSWQMNIHGYNGQYVGDSGWNTLEYDKKIKTSNLYDKKLVINGKLVSNDPTGGIQDYSDSILSGYIPVETNKIYTASCGNNLLIGAIFFYNNDKPVCASESWGAQYGEWTTIDGKVELHGKWNDSSRTFKILDSSINRVMWYVAKNGDSNYYGPHTSTELNSIISKIQMNEGEKLLQYEPYSFNIYELANKNKNDILKNTEEIEKLNSNRKNNFSVIKNGIGNNSKLRIICKGNKKYNIIHDVTLESKKEISGNPVFNYIDMIRQNKDDGIEDSIKYVNDDICPLYASDSYIAANHGWYIAQKITSANHGMTKEDIGSQWTDGAGHDQFILVTIPNENELIFIYQDYSCVTENNYSTYMVKAVSPFKNKSGGIHKSDISFTKNERDQLHPSVIRHEIKLYIDDNSIDTSKAFEVDANKVVISEHYEVLEVTSMLSNLLINYPNNDEKSYYTLPNIRPNFTIDLLRQFSENGAITEYQNLSINTKLDGCANGIVQGLPIKGSNIFIYPNATTNDLWKPFELVPGKENIPVETNMVVSCNSLQADRIFALGYDLTFGATSVPSNRNTGGDININSQKMYPRAYNVFKDPNNVVSAVAFRCYSELPENRFKYPIIWYRNGDFIILHLMARNDEIFIFELPDFFVGYKIEAIEEKSCNLGTPSKTQIITTNKISFTALASDAHGIYKLYK